MSRTMTFHNISHKPANNPFKDSLDALSTSETFDDIDARLLRLNRETLPRSPYLLSIPSLCTRRAHKYQNQHWRIGSPFTSNEEELQYMSFLNRDWEDSLLVATGDWDSRDDMPGIGPDSRDDSISGTSTPGNDKPQRKKISLSAYKNKSKARDSSASKHLDEHRSQEGLEMKDEEPNSLASLPPQRVLKSTQTSGQSIEERRSDTTRLGLYHNERIEIPSRDNDGAKKELNSPRQIVRGLPPLLSPTLPSVIEEELAKMQHFSVSPKPRLADSNTASISSSTSDALVYSSSPTSSPRMGSGLVTNKSKKEHSSEAGVGDSSDGAVRGYKQSNLLDRNSQGPTTSRYSSKEATNDNARLGQRLLVKIKYPKTQKKTVERILQTRPVPLDGGRWGKQSLVTSTYSVEKGLSKDKDKPIGNAGNKLKEDQDKSSQRLRPEKASKEAQEHSLIANKPDNPKSLDSKQKIPEKRPRPLDDAKLQESASKRQRLVDEGTSSRNLRTPTSTDAHSAAFSGQGILETSRSLTPRKDLKSVTRRLESDERLDRTSSQSSTMPDHDVTSRRTGREPPPATKKNEPLRTQSELKRKEGERWRLENKKYLELGRKLKHEADEILRRQAGNGSVDANLAKLGVVLAIETVLCYIVAFTAADQGRQVNRQPGEAQNWRSLLPFWEFVEKKSRQFPALQGLCLQIGAVCREIIHALDIERLSNDPLPSGLGEDPPPPTPGAENSNAAEEADTKIKSASYRREYMAFRNNLVENARIVRSLWIESSYKLGIDQLQDCFPSTWARREKPPFNRLAEKMTPGVYSGSFRLPLGPHSTGVETVRACWNILQEWARAEGVNWKGSLPL